jgi:hypothetical protein
LRGFFENDGAVEIAEALKINSTLNELSLEFSSIGKEGAIAIAKALKINSTLSNLNLGIAQLEMKEP